MTADAPVPAGPASLRLAELLAARLCHDLSGALGSVMGAIELMAADPGMADDAMPIAQDAASALGRRLRLVRAAWGAGAEAMTTADLRRLAEGLPAGKRIAVALDELEPATFSAPAARLILNVLMLAVESLGGSGEVALSGNPAQGVAVLIAGPRAAWPAGFAAMLADEAAAWAAIDSSRTLQAPVTALIARQSGLGLSMMLPSGDRPGDAAPAPLMLRLG